MSFSEPSIVADLSNRRSLLGIEGGHLLEQPLELLHSVLGQRLVFLYLVLLPKEIVVFLAQQFVEFILLYCVFEGEAAQHSCEEDYSQGEDVCRSGIVLF